MYFPIQCLGFLTKIMVTLSQVVVTAELVNIFGALIIFQVSF